MDLSELTAELVRLQGEQQYQREQAQIWTNDSLRTEGKIQYVADRIQQLQVEQAQAEAARLEAEHLVAEAAVTAPPFPDTDWPDAKAQEAATGAYLVRGDEPAVQQDAPSGNGHLDAEFGEPLPAEQVA